MNWSDAIKTAVSFFTTMFFLWYVTFGAAVLFFYGFEESFLYVVAAAFAMIASAGYTGWKLKEYVG